MLINNLKFYASLIKMNFEIESYYFKEEITFVWYTIVPCGDSPASTPLYRNSGNFDLPRHCRLNSIF